MLGLTNGELFVVAFIVVAVVSAPWWPRAGGAIAAALAGKHRANSKRRASDPG
jgi:hypothetical protein